MTIAPDAPPSPSSAASALARNAAASGWSGPDIYDALAARWPRLLTAGKRRRQALVQLHARSPVDLRPLSRRGHRRIAKTLALFAMADLRLAALGEGDAARERGARALDALAADTGAGERAWGYPWDVQTRWSHYRAGDPNVVVTAFAIEALRDGARVLEVPGYAERAAAASRWVQDRLFVEDLGVYAYHEGSRAVVHNASLLGARAAWHERERDPRVLRAVGRAVERTLAAQAADGSFPYGEGPGLEWVDSFHTAYVLECLAALADVDAGVRPALERGASYFCERFFDRRGRALLWPGRPFPEDAHSAGSGLTALCRLWEAGLADADLIARVADRAATAMVRDGRAIHRRYRRYATRVHYVRWADAHVALGLANAATVLSGGRAGEPRPRTGAAP